MKASTVLTLSSCNSIQKCRSAFHLENSCDCIFHVEMKDSINSGESINLEKIVSKMYFICVYFGEGEDFINRYSPHFFSHFL